MSETLHKYYFFCFAYVILSVLNLDHYIYKFVIQLFITISFDSYLYIYRSCVICIILNENNVWDNNYYLIVVIHEYTDLVFQNQYTYRVRDTKIPYVLHF